MHVGRMLVEEARLLVGLLIPVIRIHCSVLMGHLMKMRMSSGSLSTMNRLKQSKKAHSHYIPCVETTSVNLITSIKKCALSETSLLYLLLP